MDLSRELKVVSYTIEVWDWKTEKYVADISKILTSDLDIEWTLNDVESVEFSIDLVQFKRMCLLMGVQPDEVLTPYVHDIRIRRNGEYILGAQVVETNISINNNSPATIQVRCTGFLNLFKDRYISIPWSTYKPNDIARAMVDLTQRGDNLVKNPTIDIDTSYWLCNSGTMTRGTSSAYKHSGAGGLRIYYSSAQWLTAATRLDVPAGTPLMLTVWVKAASGKTINFRERSLATVATNQILIGSLTGNGGWQQFTGTFTTTWDNEYLHIEASSSTYFYIDDCYVYLNDEYNSLNKLNVGLGINESSQQTANLTLNYQLQNIKDALINLTEMENSHFEFNFSADRTFNCYSRIGSNKFDIEAVYPGNIHSMTITKSASNLANKILNIGSGIGDERLQVITSDNTSRSTYGTRQSVVTRNNVSVKATLESQGRGDLADRKNPTNLPKVVIRDGSINPSNVRVGDSIIVKIENDDYLDLINGLYRVLRMQASIDAEMMENITLTLEPTGYVF